MRTKKVTELSDESGNVVAHYEYSPFGSLTKVTGDHAGSNPFRFSSEYYDEETGLVYYNYRYYNPELGRWISRDPIEEQGGYNLYGMIGNNPLYGWNKEGNGAFFFAKPIPIGRPLLYARPVKTTPKPSIPRTVSPKYHLSCRFNNI